MLPGFRTKLVAFETEKLKVELCPLAMLTGLAVKDVMIGADAGAAKVFTQISLEGAE